MKPLAGLWHWSPEQAGAARLSKLDELCKQARQAGLDYITFKALDGAQDRFLTDAQLATAQKACKDAGLKFSLWQYVYAVRPPSEEAQSFAKIISRFKPAFVFIDVEVEYEKNPNPVSAEYTAAFRKALPKFPATVCPFGRADLHPGIDYKVWHDRGFGVAPQAYECDSTELTPAKCAQSFKKWWPIEKQWTAVGFYKGAHARLTGAQIGASLRGLPVANVSGWWSGDATFEQMRGIASHHGAVEPEPKPAPATTTTSSTSIKAAQRRLIACGFSVRVTGKMDRATGTALRFFQQGWCGKEALEPHGKLTAETAEALAWSAAHGGGLGPKAKNFHYQEFRLDNTKDPRVRRRVGLAVQAYRERFGPTTILSSGRSVAHNDFVGGASDSRHLYPKYWDAIDPSPQVHSVSEVKAVKAWTGIGHHAAAPQSVDHFDLRPGSASDPSVFPDH